MPAEAPPTPPEAPPDDEAPPDTPATAAASELVNSLDDLHAAMHQAVDAFHQAREVFDARLARARETIEAAAELSRFVPSTAALTELTVSMNDIGVGGAMALATAVHRVHLRRDGGRAARRAWRRGGGVGEDGAQVDDALLLMIVLGKRVERVASLV